MKTLCGWIPCIVVVLLLAPSLRARDLSKYRGFSLGTNLATVLKLTDQKLADVKVIHEHPALIEDVTWWPPSIPGPSYRSDSVEQILFSFYDGKLYKMFVTYDQASTEGLTSEDMVTSISAKYGLPAFVMPEVDTAKTHRYEVTHKLIAMWDDSQYSFNLVRSSFAGRFGLIICSKRVDAEAQRAVTEAMKLEEQAGPQKDADRQKKQLDNLEIERQKNRKIFRP